MADIEDSAVLGEKAVNERVDQDRWEEAQEYLNSDDTDVEEDVNITDDEGEEQYFHLPTTDASGLKNEGGFEMRDVPLRGKEAPGTVDGRIVLRSKFIPKLHKLPGMQVAGAGLDGVSKLLNTAQDVANFAAGQADPKTGESRWGDVIPTVPEDASMSGGMTDISRPMITYLADFYLSKKMTQTLGILKNSKKSKAALDGIIANFVAFDRDQSGLSELIEHYPQLSNPVTRFLQTRKEDPNVVAKLKKVTDGAIGGLVADKLFGGFLNVLRVYRDRQFVSNLQKDRAARNTKGQPLIGKHVEDFPDEGATGKRRRQLRKQGQSETAKVLRDEEPGVATGKVKDIPRKKPRYSINYDTIDSIQDIKNMMAQLRRMTENELVEDLKDASILELLPEVKEEILADPTAAIQESFKVDPRQATRKQKVVARVLDVTSAAHMLDVRNKVLAGELPEDEMLRSIILWKKLHSIKSQMHADWGRTGKDMQTPVSPMEEALPDFSDALDDYAADEGLDIENLSGMQAAEMLGLLEDASKRKQFLEKLEGPSGLKMFTELWMSGLLSGIPTHEVNFAMTSLNILNHFLPETLWTATFDALGGVPKEDRTHFRQVGKSLYKFNETMRHAYKLAKAAWKVTKTGGESEELNEIGGPNVVKLEGFGEPQATVANLNKLMKRHQVAAGKKEEFFQFDEAGWMGMLFDGTFNLFRTVGARPVITSDTYLKAVAYRLALLDKAWESGYAQDLTGKTLVEHVDEFMKNPPEDMQIHAQSLARELTFTAEPGRIGEVLEHAVNKLPLLRLPFPFVRTPTQINKTTFEKLPGLNLFVKESREDIFGKGPEKGRGARRSRALAKLAMGGSIAYLAYQMADAGTATGSGPVGPNSKETRATLKAAGWQEDSIVWQADDKSLHYYSFDRADPFGMVFGLMVDFKKFRTHVDPEVADNAELALLLSISKQLLSKTWATNARKIFDVILAPDRTDARSLKQLAGTLVPRLVAQMGKNIDPHIKETRTLFDQIMANTPGVSKFLENKHDWLGTPIVDEGHLWSTLTPTRHSTTSGRKDSDLRFEAATVGARFAVPDGYAVDEHGAAVNITGPQEIWLVKHIARGVKAPITEIDKHGNDKKVMKTFVEAMRGIIQTKEYQLKKDPLQRDKDGKPMTVPTSNADRAAIWKSVYNDYKKVAVADFKAKHPAVADRFRRMLEIETSELTGHDMKIRNNRMTLR